MTRVCFDSLNLHCKGWGQDEKGLELGDEGTESGRSKKQAGDAWSLVPDPAQCLPPSFIVPTDQHHGTSYPPRVKGSAMPVGNSN